MSARPAKLLFFVTEDWYFVSHRLPLAIAARNAGYEVAVATRVREHGDRIRAAGVRLIPFENLRSGMNPLRELATLVRLIRLYRREKPDIVHHVALKPVLYGSIAARLCGTPCVINALAGMGWLYASRRGVQRTVQRLVRLGFAWMLRSGRTLVQNPDDARLLVELGIPDANIRRVAGAGVDLREFSPQPEPPGVAVVLLPARVLWEKGVGEFAAAARLIKNRGLAARFVIAGEPDRASPDAVPAAQIEAWVAEGILEHAGWVDDMAAQLAASAIVALPSYREGLPKALIEAAAVGRPIVTADVPGCREVVRDGLNGFLVPARRAPELADAISRLLEDPSLRKRMGERGRLLAEKEFGLESVIAQTLALYREPQMPPASLPPGERHSFKSG